MQKLFLIIMSNREAMQNLFPIIMLKREAILFFFLFPHAKA